MDADNCGYGSSGCSQLQAEWQREHVIFRNVTAGSTIKSLLSNNPLLWSCVLIPLSFFFPLLHASSAQYRYSVDSK